MTVLLEYLDLLTKSCDLNTPIISVKNLEAICRWSLLLSMIYSICNCYEYNILVITEVQDETENTGNNWDIVWVYWGKTNLYPSQQTAGVSCSLIVFQTIHSTCMQK